MLAHIYSEIFQYLNTIEEVFNCMVEKNAIRGFSTSNRNHIQLPISDIRIFLMQETLILCEFTNIMVYNNVLTPSLFNCFNTINILNITRSNLYFLKKRHLKELVENKGLNSLTMRDNYITDNIMISEKEGLKLFNDLTIYRNLINDDSIKLSINKLIIYDDIINLDIFDNIVDFTYNNSNNDTYFKKMLKYNSVNIDNIHYNNEDFNILKLIALNRCRKAIIKINDKVDNNDYQVENLIYELKLNNNVDTTIILKDDRGRLNNEIINELELKLKVKITVINNKCIKFKYVN